MTTSTRYTLAAISRMRILSAYGQPPRLGLIGQPWISSTPPVAPAQRARWRSILASLLCILTVAATIYAGGK